MKKLLPLLLALVLFVGCDKNESGGGEQTFFVNVYTQKTQDAEKKLANASNPNNLKCYVYLFEDTGKEIDKEASYYSVNRDKEIVYTDKTTAKYKYASSSPGLAVNIFEDIPNGEYILFVCFVSYGYVDGAAHKNIVVNSSYSAHTENKVFLYKEGGGSPRGNYGYQEWDEKW